MLYAHAVSADERNGPVLREKAHTEVPLGPLPVQRAETVCRPLHDVVIAPRGLRPSPWLLNNSLWDAAGRTQLTQMCSEAAPNPNRSIRMRSSNPMFHQKDRLRHDLKNNPRIFESVEKWFCVIFETRQAGVCREIPLPHVGTFNGFVNCQKCLL